jgi:hypothetical protein
MKIRVRRKDVKPTENWSLAGEVDPAGKPVQTPAGVGKKPEDESAKPTPIPVPVPIEGEGQPVVNRNGPATAQQQQQQQGTGSDVKRRKSPQAKPRTSKS